MGFIDDGSISGFLPSTKSFAVHYPGYPSSTVRAVETLGGTEGIVKARSLESNKLELHFRPEDPYSHPALGELHPCNKFLLKISKKKDGDGQSANNLSSVSKCLSEDPINLKQKINCPELMANARVSQPETEPIAASTEVEGKEKLFADVIAQVSEAYHFNGMVDYQHVVAVHADVARKKKRNWADVEPQFEKRGLMDVDQEDLMILVPPLFSPKDIPEKVVLKPSLDVNLKKKQAGVVQHRWEMDIEPSLAIDFNIKAPPNLDGGNDFLQDNGTRSLFHRLYSYSRAVWNAPHSHRRLEIPKQVSWEKYIPKGSDQWEWQMAVCELFDERPIWIKDSLAERLLDKGLKFGGTMLRRLLFRAAYYFSNGPFLRFWIRKGYDPRKDPESRIYQRIDFRVPPALRSYCDTNIASGLRHRWEDICAFRVFPYKCQISLQLFELADDYIQQEIRKPSNQATCSCATGWFSSRELDTLRLCVAVRFLSVYPKAGAESLRKSAAGRFEKSKRMQIFAKDPRLDEEGQQQVDRELVGNEDKELNADDEDEEDEIEDDTIEEELDAYETLDLGDEDGNFSPQPCSYTDHENISKNYLQDLFGSFPLGEAGGTELQDADTNDGEYQIYEQYSDGNYSDDDDAY